MNYSNERKLIRISEASKLVGCTPQNIYLWINDKKLKTYKRYGITLVDKTDIERLKAEVKPRGMPRGKT